MSDSSKGSSAFEEDFSDGLYSLEFNVKDFLLRNAYKALFEGIESITVEFRVDGLSAFEIDGAVAAGGVIFGDAKRVMFPNSASVWGMVTLVALLPQNQEIGSCAVKLDDFDLDHSDRDCVSACYRLQNNEGVVVGALEMSISAVRLGHFVNEGDETASCVTEDCRWIGPPCPSSTPSEEEPRRGPVAADSAQRHVVHFHTHENRQIVVDWQGPAKAAKKLPPYHEDVAVQTQEVRKPPNPSKKGN